MSAEQSMRYSTIVADPPWPLPWKSISTRTGGGWGRPRLYTVGRPTIGYDTMTVEEIADLPVHGHTNTDAHLYLWSFDKFVITGEAAGVAQAWGFEPKRLLIWKKPGFGLGTFPRPQHELILVCTRGALPFHGPKNIGSVQEWPFLYEQSGRSVARKHSAKPEAFLDLVEQVSPGPYLELFARRQRLGWDTWGHEALEHVQIRPKWKPTWKQLLEL